jgi:DNA-binding CsgD family transcriptional regulator
MGDNRSRRARTLIVGVFVFLVGRARELNQIALTLAAVEEGHAPKVVLIEGEAGFGKSALLGAACAQADRDGWLVARATCHSVQASLPLAVVRSIVRSLLDALGERSGKYAAGLDTVLQAGSTETATQGLVRLLEGVTLDLKVLVAVDDAQWADADSLRALADLTIALSERRVALLLAMRPNVSARHLPMAIETVVPLVALNAADSASVVRRTAPDANQEVIDEAVKHAAGHPLDLVALSQAIARDRITSPSDLAASRRALIAADVRSEAPDLREFLQVCSLVESGLDRQLIAQLWTDDEMLDELLVRASGRYLQTDGSRATFVHALIAEGIRETIAVQTPFRRRIIAAIERFEDPPPETFELLAEQFAACGDYESAFSTLASLAQAAATRSDFRLCASAASRALQYSKPPAKRAAPFYTMYADALFNLDRDAEAAALLEEALQANVRVSADIPGHAVARLVLSQLFSDQQEKAQRSYRYFTPLIVDPLERAHALSASLWFAVAGGETEESKSAEAELAALDECLSPMVRVRVAAFKAYLRSFGGDYAGAAALLKHARRVAAQAVPGEALTESLGILQPSMFVSLFEFGTRAMSAYLDRWASLEPAGSHATHVDWFRALIAFLEGRWGACELELTAALERTPSPTMRRRLLAIAAAIAALRGQPSEHQAAIESEVGPFLNAQCHGAAAPMCAWWAATSTSEERASRAILRGVLGAMSRPSDLSIDMPSYMPKLALVAAAHRLGDEASLRSIASDDVWVPQTPWHVAHHRLARNVATTLLGETVDSPSATIAECAGLGLSLYADVLRFATGTETDAAKERLGALGITWLGAGKPREAKSSARPTARELQVAEQLAEGKTNREIAASLVLSLRTVEAHIANLFNKIGVSSRTQLVGWYLRQREAT